MAARPTPAAPRKTLVDPMQAKRVEQASRKFFHAAVPSADMEKTATAAQLKRRLDAVMGLDANIQQNGGPDRQPEA